MTDKVRLASIGTGRWGSELAEAVARTGTAEVVSGWARRPEGREAFASKHGPALPSHSTSCSPIPRWTG